MSEKVEIRTFKSKIWKGRYTNGKHGPTIWIREDLSPQERTLTFKHEFTHHKFYTQTRLGRALNHFFNMRFLIPYALLIGLCWIFLPIFYLPLCVPFWLIDVHELITSLKYPSVPSFLIAFTEMIGLYAFYWLRFLMF